MIKIIIVYKSYYLLGDRKNMDVKKISKLEDCLDIKKLYEENFPKKERTNFYSLLSGLYASFELYALYDKNTVKAFVHLNSTADFVHINYFAVSKLYQGHGIGSQFLTWLKKKFIGKPIVLDVELENQNNNNNFDRVRRINFYKKNGFVLSNYVFEWQKELFSPMYYGKLDIDEFKIYIKKLLLEISKLN